jgi:FixJ family two-component response regulator
MPTPHAGDIVRGVGKSRDETSVTNIEATAHQDVNTETVRARRTIYVIDDDGSTRRALTRLLSASGFTATEFESAEAFLEAGASDEDACLLVDVYMPGMNGIELCRRLAASGRKLPTILMTAHTDPRTRLLAARANPIATLYKPIDEESLLAAIAAAPRGAN